GSEDLILVHSGLKTVVLRLNWPGYFKKLDQPTEIISSDGHITRIQLAQKAANVIAKFMVMYTYEECRKPEWSFAPGNLEIQQTRLLSLTNVSSNIWEINFGI
ncbi:hypothetical protein CPB83DRAFT_730617, partial [Crepidotus variabilis]